MSPESFMTRWRLEPLPMIAILRGLEPDMAVEAAQTLLACGFRYLEVPLNSPSPARSIRLMRDATGDRGFVGAGTVLTVEEVDRIADCGGQLIISPNCDPAVIRHSRARGLISLPGVVTPGEAFRAIAAGASALKFFPAEQVTPAVMRALRAVIPAHVACLPVGGIRPDASQMRSYIQGGANGFGLGGGLYQPGVDIPTLRARALAYQHAWRACVA